MELPEREHAVRSFLTPYGYQSGSCGYCKNPESASYYVHSDLLDPQHYQELMDRSWRRSGRTLYFPDNRRSCCAHYAIRLPVKDYQPRRDQRQALHRWNRFVLGEECEKKLKLKQKPKSRLEKRQQANSFDLISTIHQSEFDQIPPDCKPQHHFTVTLEQDDFTEEKYKLFEQYQLKVHHETPSDVSRRGFRRFLCESPVQCSTSLEPEVKMIGSYHQMYHLDGKLIAFSVLDLLPRGVSAAYFVYDVEYERFSFGKLSAMREATLALEAGYENYYMGFYIHSCPKMRYKADFKPQHLLDLDTLEWDPIDDEVGAMMDAQKFVVVSRERRKRALANGSAREEEKGTAGLVDDNTDFIHPTPAEASSSGVSLFDLHIPGIMPLDRVLEEVDLGECRIVARRGPSLPVHMLTAWDDGDPKDPATIKGLVAELVACIGPSVAKGMALKFGGS